jgi:hypothetical protein
MSGYLDMRHAPQAHSVRIMFCVGQECQRPHVVLFNEDEEVIASFVLPDPRPDGTSFAGDLMNAQEQSLVARGLRGSLQ